MHEFRYIRLFSDTSGESHFQDIAVSPDRELSVPPAPPLRMRALGPAVTVALVGGDSGWHGEVAHPAPFRMLQSYLSGTVEVTASDGESRRFGPGSLVLLEDTRGQGHSTRILGEDAVMLVTQLADTGPDADLATPPGQGGLTPGGSRRDRAVPTAAAPWAAASTLVGAVYLVVA